VKKIIAITLFTFLSLSVSAQIEFNICIPTSWVGGGSAELTIENNSGNIIPAGSVLELNWPGILTINPWGGFTVSGSNPFLLTITNALQPGPNGPLNFGFTSSGGYFAHQQVFSTGLLFKLFHLLVSYHHPIVILIVKYH